MESTRPDNLRISVKCICCNAETRTLDTRVLSGGEIKRRRECGNGHRFLTQEVAIAICKDGEYRTIAVANRADKRKDQRTCAEDGKASASMQ